MKRIYRRIFFICSLCMIFPVILAQNPDCSIEIPITQNLVTETSGIQPGDVVCLLPGFRDFIQFKNLHGTSENPIIITHKDGVVLFNSTGSYGIKFNNCSHVRLTGTGVEAVPYGLIISQVANGAGISVDNLSTNVEIDHIEIANTPIGGIYAKTEPDPTGDCTFPATREKFTLYNLIVHDCYLHDIGDEGMYIGSSKFLGQTIYHCNDTVVLPHVLEGVKVYNNILERTGWDAIQVSSTVLNCEIYNNIIREDSYKEEPFQMSGILIGGGSNCDCYNNIILNGKGDGIDYVGMGGNKIFNNVIARAGLSYHPFDSSNTYQKHGIWMGDVYTEPDKDMYIYNNTIVEPRNYGLKIHNASLVETYFQNNIVCSPMAYQSSGYNPYYTLDWATMSIVDNNNYFTKSCNDMLFVNASSNNFDLKEYSPAINGGMDMLFLGLDFDIEYRPRPVGGFFDIGAYEFQLVGIEEYFNESGNIVNIKVFPNPSENSCNIHYELKSVSHVKISLINAIGEPVKVLLNKSQERGKHYHTLKIQEVEAGVYFFRINSGNDTFLQRIIKL